MPQTPTTQKLSPEEKLIIKIRLAANGIRANHIPEWAKKAYANPTLTRSLKPAFDDYHKETKELQDQNS